MSFMNRLWYESQSPMYGLLPFAYGYKQIMAIRRWLYKVGLKKTTYFPIPIIVVGNLTVGGTGKTPFAIYLARQLKQHGWNPGLVSRGYGGNHSFPHVVKINDDARIVGDEALLLLEKTGCPLVVGKNRVAAVKKLLDDFGCDIVISDDGLQHLSLGRRIEIVVIDSERRFGNGLCLPAGPLREPINRLDTVDFIVNNGSIQKNEWEMRLIPGEIYALHPTDEIYIMQSIERKSGFMQLLELVIHNVFLIC